MRREGHITERSSGHWLIRYSVGTDPATGRRHRVNVTFHGDRKGAEKELRRLQKAADDGAHVDPARITVRDWGNQWLDTIRPEVAPKTHERYGELFRHFIAPALGNLQLPKLAPVLSRNAIRNSPRAAGATGSPAG